MTALDFASTAGLRRMLLALFMVPVAIIAVSCSDGLPPEFPIPEFSLKSPITGEVVDNTTIEGRPAILYWFTSW